jgi:hypothetical protein
MKYVNWKKASQNIRLAGLVRKNYVFDRCTVDLKSGERYKKNGKLICNFLKVL